MDEIGERGLVGGGVGEESEEGEGGGGEDVLGESVDLRARGAVEDGGTGTGRAKMHGRVAAYAHEKDEDERKLHIMATAMFHTSLKGVAAAARIPTGRTHGAQPVPNPSCSHISRRLDFFLAIVSSQC